MPQLPRTPHRGNRAMVCAVLVTDFVAEGQLTFALVAGGGVVWDGGLPRGGGGGGGAGAGGGAPRRPGGRGQGAACLARRRCGPPVSVARSPIRQPPPPAPLPRAGEGRYGARRRGRWSGWWSPAWG